VRVYATNYNVLRIMSGMGGLAYSNWSRNFLETSFGLFKKAIRSFVFLILNNEWDGWMLV
jgi:hypothetical protein